MNVAFFQRKPFTNINYSLEQYFKGVREHLPKPVVSHKIIMPYQSKGLLKRLAIIFYSAKNQKDINHFTGDIYFANLLCSKRKTILTILDIGFMQNPSRIKRFLLEWLWIRLPEKKAQFITVISQATKDELLKIVKCDPNKITVVPVFINKLFRREFKKTPFQKDCPVILQVGTKPNKNIDRLFDALEGISCKLDIVGPISETQRKALKDKNISFSNSVNISDEEIVSKYENCDIVSFVSTYEGFGMPIVEANAVGKPVVTSDLLSMPEVAGGSACLVDPFSVSSIRNGIQKIIQEDDFRKLLVEKGYDNKKRFDPEVIANQYVEIYKKIKIERN